MKVTRLSDVQMDAVKEAAFIDMGHASSSLSQMVEREIRIDTLVVDFLDINKIPERIGGPHTLATGIYLRIIGDITGTSLLLLPRDSAVKLADILLNKDIGATTVLTQDDRSALCELGNILTGSFLNALSDLLGMKIYPTVPSIVFDMADSIMSFVTAGIDRRIERVLLIEVMFSSSYGDIRADFVLMFDVYSLGDMLKALDKKLKKVGENL